MPVVASNFSSQLLDFKQDQGYDLDGNYEGDKHGFYFKSGSDQFCPIIIIDMLSEYDRMLAALKLIQARRKSRLDAQLISLRSRLGGNVQK